MYKLNKERFSSVEGILKSVEINCTFAMNVLKKVSDGVVYVDSLESPKTLYIKHKCGMSLICGDYSNRVFIDDILNRVVSKEGLQAFPKKMNKSISTSPFYAGISEYVRLNLKFNREKFYKNNIITEDKNVIDVANYSFKSFKGRVVPSAYFDNEEEFSKKGLCFGIVENGEVVSWAVSSFKGEKSLEIGVETLEKCRGKNYAYRACSAFINYCLDRGIEPIWSCEEINVGSLTLAKKLGFEVLLKTAIYSIP